MHIALNALLLSAETSYRAAGVSKYSHGLLHALEQNAAFSKEMRLTAFVPAGATHVLSTQPDSAQRASTQCGSVRPRGQWGSTTSRRDIPPTQGITLEPTRLPVHNPLIRIAWEQLWLPRRLAQTQADLIHGLVNVLPLATGIPGVVTVHDLSFLRMPEMLPGLKRRYLAALCRASVYKAAHVIAVSRQTADDLMHYFGLPSRKISIIHNGVDERFRPDMPAQVEAFRQQKGLPARFLLYVGTLEPRKNLPLLIRAFVRWKAKASIQDQDVKLVIAGAKGWFYAQIFAEVSRLNAQEDVLFPGYLPEEELPDWYRAAHAFVYPTLFEGFGLPVLEAMACGIPVICSQAQSLLEIVGEQALTHAVDDEDGLVQQIRRMIEQPDLRSALSAGGRERATRFSWHRTAAETLAIYNSL